MTIRRRSLLDSYKNAEVEELSPEDQEKEELVNKYLAEKSPTKTLGSTSPFRKSARLDGWILFLLIAYKLPSEELVEKALDDLENKTNNLGDFLMAEFQEFVETEQEQVLTEDPIVEDDIFEPESFDNMTLQELRTKQLIIPDACFDSYLTFPGLSRGLKTRKGMSMYEHRMEVKKHLMKMPGGDFTLLCYQFNLDDPEQKDFIMMYNDVQKARTGDTRGGCTIF